MEKIHNNTYIHTHTHTHTHIHIFNMVMRNMWVTDHYISTSWTELRPDCNRHIETCLVWCGSLKHLPQQFMKQKMLESFRLSKCSRYMETVIASPSLNSGYACFYFLTRAVVSASHDWSALIVRGVVWLNSSECRWSFRLGSLHGTQITGVKTYLVRVGCLSITARIDGSLDQSQRRWS